MLDQAGLHLVLRHLPDLLQPQPVALRVAPVAQVEAVDQVLRAGAPAALGKQRLPGVQLHAAHERVLRRAVLVDPHVRRRHAVHAAAVRLVAIQDLRGGEAWVDLHAELLGLGS